MGHAKMYCGSRFATMRYAVLSNKKTKRKINYALKTPFSKKYLNLKTFFFHRKSFLKRPSQFEQIVAVKNV